MGNIAAICSSLAASALLLAREIAGGLRVVPPLATTWDSSLLG